MRNIYMRFGGFLLKLLNNSNFQEYLFLENNDTTDVANWCVKPVLQPSARVTRARNKSDYCIVTYQ